MSGFLLRPFPFCDFVMTYKPDFSLTRLFGHRPHSHCLWIKDPIVVPLTNQPWLHRVLWTIAPPHVRPKKVFPQFPKISIYDEARFRNFDLWCLTMLQFRPSYLHQNLESLWITYEAKWFIFFCLVMFWFFKAFVFNISALFCLALWWGDNTCLELLTRLFFRNLLLSCAKFNTCVLYLALQHM